MIGRLDYFLVENVRTARRFVSSLKLGRKIEELHFEMLDKNTPAHEVEAICNPLVNGRDMGVMSEAGCPGIADPGHLAVSFAHRHDITVVPLSGPSSIFMALMSSGFNGQSFVFHGYLPIDRQQRKNALKSMEQEAVRKGQTQIFMETPYRNDKLLADILKTCHPQTLLCVASDITGPDEIIRTMSIKNWQKSMPDLHKRPTIFLLYA